MDKDLLITAGTCGLAVSGISLLGSCASPHEALLRPLPERPNVVVILADDLGYGDVSCNGAVRISTPNVDALARAGRCFQNGYCTAATCTPTRYSLLTGQYGFRKKGCGIAPPNAPALIPAGTETVGSVMRNAGYATAVIGKWHLGLGVGKPDWNGELNPGPLEVGFDYCLLLPTTNDRVPQVLVENHRVKNLDPADPLWVGMEKPSPDHPNGIDDRKDLRMDWSHGHNNTIQNGIGRIGFYTGGKSARFRDEDLSRIWVDAADKWISGNKSHPFFLLLTPHDIHVPRMPNEQFQGKSALGPRGDMILEFDWIVGEVTKSLARNGLAENTLIIVTSDNGPVLDDGYRDGAVEMNGSHKPAGPYRGGKYSIYEGGTRMPFIVCWPGVVKPAIVQDAMVSTVDLAASFAALTGVKLANNVCVDSQNVLPALLGTGLGRSVIIEQTNEADALAIREGNVKLVRFAGPKGKLRHELYHLDTDPSETKNCAAAEPETVQRLSARLDAVIAAGNSRTASQAAQTSGR